MTRDSEQQHRDKRGARSSSTGPSSNKPRIPHPLGMADLGQAIAQDRLECAAEDYAPPARATKCTDQGRAKRKGKLAIAPGLPYVPISEQINRDNLLTQDYEVSKRGSTQSTGDKGRMLLKGEGIAGKRKAKLELAPATPYASNSKDSRDALPTQGQRRSRQDKVQIGSGEDIASPVGPGAVAVRGADYRPGGSIVSVASKTTTADVESQRDTEHRNSSWNKAFAQAVPLDEEELAEELARRERRRIMDEAPRAQVVDDSMVKPSCKRGRLALVTSFALFVVIGAVVGTVLGTKKSTPAPAPTTSPTETPNEWEADLCLALDDGSIGCILEQTPAASFLTVFLECPDLEGGNVLECEFCGVVEVGTAFEPGTIDNLDELDLDRLCNGCLICDDRISYDCTNIANGTCAKTDCEGECIG